MSLRQPMEYQPRVGKNVFIAPGVVCGKGVVIEDNAVIREGTVLYDQVHVGSGTFVGPHCVLGEPQRDQYDNADKPFESCRIGAESIIRTGSVIYAGAQLGDHCETGAYAQIREETNIGHHTRIGTYADIQSQVKVGNYVSMHSNVTVGALSVIEDYAWLMPYAMLINDWYPPTCLRYEGPVVGEFAVIGARAILYPGARVATHCFVTAGAGVKGDFPEYSLITGDPARIGGDVRKLLTMVDGRLVAPYPWRQHRKQNYPWAE